MKSTYIRKNKVGFKEKDTMEIIDYEIILRKTNNLNTHKNGEEFHDFHCKVRS